MRILLINNFFRDVGGVERVLKIERDLLQTHGHTVIDFATAHAQNWPSPYAKFFPRGFDFHASGNFFAKAARFFYSPQVARALTALIHESHPDVAHIHGVFDELGPTVLYTLEKLHVPMVYTAHAYKLICPNWKLFAHGHIDEACVGHPFHDAWNASIQNSFGKSFGAALAWTHMKKCGAFDALDRIMSPSQFLIEKHVAAGWSREKFVHVPNPFQVVHAPRAQGDGAYILFVGRLVTEKGVATLVDAATQLPEVQFKIVGDGPARASLEKRARARSCTNISFEGACRGEDVAEYMRHARAVVVPSVWYENDPYSILEAQAAGIVVIASRIGGIPEQIIDGRTGFLCEPENADALATTIRRVATRSHAEREHIITAAHAMVQAIRDPELYYESLVSILSGMA